MTFDTFEVIGDGGDTVFVSSRQDHRIALTVIDGDSGQSVYVLFSTADVERLSDAMLAARRLDE